MLILFSLMHVVYALDRAMPSILAEPVKRDFALSDSQLGLFLGLSYGLSFGIASLFAGPIVDRTNRVRMFALLAFVWCLATTLCGLATGFVMLLLLRLVIGAAEAGSSPAAFSIMSDRFPAHQRGMAIGFYKIGSPMGIVAAGLIGTYIAAEYGWRTAFFVAGLPGCLLAVIVWRWVPEPERGRLDPKTTRVAPQSLSSIALHVYRAPGSFLLILGIVLVVFGCSGVSAFAVAYLQRVHHLTLAQASGYFSLATSVGIISPLLLGLMNDRLARLGLHRALNFSAAVALAVTLAGTVMLLSDSPAIAVAGLVVWQAISVGTTAPNYAALLSVTPAAMRGTVSALLLLGVNMIGVGSAPSFVGVLSDWLGGGTAVRYAMLIDLAFCLPAMICFVVAGRQIAAGSRNVDVIKVI